jgi:hypothetical protein
VAEPDALRHGRKTIREAADDSSFKTSTIGTIGSYWILAPGIRVAQVLGTHVVVSAAKKAFTETTRPVVAAARVIGAQVIVVAHDACAEILFACAFYAGAGNAIPIARRTIPFSIENARAVKAVASIVRAIISVVADDILAWVLVAHAPNTDASMAVEVTGHVVYLRVFARPIAGAGLRGAVVTVVAGHAWGIVVLTPPGGAARTDVAFFLSAVLGGPAFRADFTASHKRQHTQPADT